MKFHKVAVTLLAVALAMGLGVAASAAIQYGTATVDGDLSEWTGSWNAIAVPYYGTVPAGDNASYQARWTADAVYVAIKVYDPEQILMDAYGTGNDWNTRDAVEIYFHTTGTGAGPAPDNKYAQQWVVGVKQSDTNSVWTALLGNPVPAHGGYVAAGRKDGNWLIYEMSMTPWAELGATPESSILSPLSEGMFIGLDFATVHKNATTDGMLSLNSSPGKWGDHTIFAQHQLVPEPGSMLALASGLGGLVLFRRKRA